MSVRRLHPDQPASFAFSAENLAYARKVISRYPEGKEASAVIPVLMLGQVQEGWVSRPMIEAVADLLGMPYIRVLEIATFYTQFQLSPVGKTAHIQVCGTTPCRLRGADEIIKICRKRIADHPFELSADGQFSWEEVECLGACVNAPMVAVGADTYEDLTEETFNKLIDGLEAGNPPAPGPQNGRFHATPEGGDTALTDPSLYDGSVIGKHRAYAREELTTAPTAAPIVSPAPAPKPAPAAAPAAKPTEDVVEKVSDEFKPALLGAARDGKADDLKLIWGVGPKLEELLHSLGVFHFDQIAVWSDMNISWIDQHLGSFRGRAVRDKWVEQCKKLASGWRPSDKDGDKPV
jgi:NADH-quinone oxidoreductase subunit E